MSAGEHGNPLCGSQVAPSADLFLELGKSLRSTALLSNRRRSRRHRTNARSPARRRRGNAMVGFDTTYLNRGFDLSANPSEIYLRVVRPSIQLDASSSGQSVGGLAKPNARIVALSRLRGLIGGNPQSGTSGKPLRAAGLAAVAGAPPNLSLDLPAAPSAPSSPNPLLNPGYGLGDTPAAAAGRFDPPNSSVARLREQDSLVSFRSRT
jgi:hypothetical protein